MEEKRSIPDKEKQSRELICSMRTPERLLNNLSELLIWEHHWGLVFGLQLEESILSISHSDSRVSLSFVKSVPSWLKHSLPTGLAVSKESVMCSDSPSL